MAKGCFIWIKTHGTGIPLFELGLLSVWHSWVWLSHWGFWRYGCIERYLRPAWMMGVGLWEATRRSPYNRSTQEPIECPL